MTENAAGGDDDGNAVMGVDPYISEILHEKQTAEARLVPLQQSLDAAKAEVRVMRDTFGINGTANSRYTIDYDKLVKGLGTGAVELRDILLATYPLERAAPADGTEPVKMIEGPIDPEFVEALGFDEALALRKMIDEHYKITGAPGEKPRVKVSAATRTAAMASVPR